jgi:hypothetical protein
MRERKFASACISLYVLIHLASCGGSSTPAGILDEKQMTKVLLEIYLAEAKVLELHVGRDSAERVFHVFEHRILEKLDIPSNKYKKSYQYYLDNPAKLERVYAAVVDSLSLREQRVSPASIQ